MMSTRTFNDHYRIRSDQDRAKLANNVGTTVYRNGSSGDWGRPEGTSGYDEGSLVNNKYGSWLLVNGSWIDMTSSDQMANRSAWTQQGEPVRTNPYDGHSISIGGNIAFGGGINLGIGVVWNNDGDWKLFWSKGPSFGVDASLGVVIKAITNNDRSKPFDPRQYAGWGSSHNIGIGLVDVVLIGGDNNPSNSTGTMGATYTEQGGGLSLSFPAAAYTYQVSHTSFIFK